MPLVLIETVSVCIEQRLSLGVIDYIAGGYRLSPHYPAINNNNKYHDKLDDTTALLPPRNSGVTP